MHQHGIENQLVLISRYLVLYSYHIPFFQSSYFQHTVLFRLLGQKLVNLCLFYYFDYGKDVLLCQRMFYCVNHKTDLLTFKHHQSLPYAQYQYININANDGVWSWFSMDHFEQLSHYTSRRLIIVLEKLKHFAWRITSPICTQYMGIQAITSISNYSNDIILPTSTHARIIGRWEP